jgi:AraC-like DNA-binding protein
MLIDVSYKETLFLKHKNNTIDDYVVLHFYLFNSDVDFFLNKEPSRFGKLDYNFLMIAGLSDIDYIVKKDTDAYGICIIIGKTTLREYLNKISKITDDIILDTKNSTIINVDRMSHQSLILINNFRKISLDSPFYEMNFKALIYALINNYLEQLKTKKMILGKVVNDDIKRLIVSRKFLQKNNEGLFPGIDFLAAEALMSVSKYKKMFTKILGLSPAVYFYNSKLEKAKKLLETKEYTVKEVANKLNYSSSSFLAKKFSRVYGVSPKEYQNLL